MERYYKIIENELVDLIAAWHKLDALEIGGVDNWPDYGAVLSEYRERWADEYDWECVPDTFEEIAREELSDYVEVD